ncbi:coiled-coil domain-containing protein 40 isoform X1 [Electrophorus electricus]|uniref:coiled-coil domain-containing protein 40 isoform X1 n=2 Tax=Electrophorus electricus TaxID=8005 RepID=UPI0015D0A4CB|nr:coiled-coil domain-containing protein 40 isoform X1 [Electrophorus electricus]
MCCFQMYGVGSIAGQDEEKTESPEEGAEACVVTAAQEGETQRVEQVETSAGDVTNSHAAASASDTLLIMHTHSEQGSSSVPEAATSLLHFRMATSMGGEGDEGARATENEEEYDEEEELIVLDPEHPLMKRFQSALKTHLTSQLERLNLELSEKVALERAVSSQQKELGVELYLAQQELAQLHARLEGRHEAGARAGAERRQAQEQQQVVQSQYGSVAGRARAQRNHVYELQVEAENLALRLHYMQDVTSDLRSDVITMKNATHKAKVEKQQAELQKHKQDLYVERLTKQEEKLREQIARYETQTLAQAAETRAAKEAVAEAQMEMDSLILEHKQLLQQWNSSLVGMKRRDEAYTTLQEALRLTNQQVCSLDTEAGGYKRSITQEQERNELLTVLLNRAQLDSVTCRKLIAQSLSQQEALQAMYSTYTRMLQETEKSLSRVTTECSVRQSELTILRKQLEKESSVRLDLEEQIVSKMQDQLTLGNAAKYSHALSEKTATHQREREAQLSKLENETAAVALEVSQVALRLESLAYLQHHLEQEIGRRHQLLSGGEAEVAKRVTVIERKQAAINVYNKKMESIVASTGHKDLGPLEIEASTLSKQLEEVGVEINEQQQFWLRQQGELVSLNQEKQDQSNTLLTLQTQLIVLQQRRVRTENKIEQECRVLAELERHSKSLMLDMQRLNSLLNQNTQQSHELEQSTSLLENSFIQELKEAERQSVEMQLRLEKLQEEKERLLNSLVEAERQIMLWERKTQLVRETRSAVDSEVGKGDIHTMKAEIHRMEVRYAQLLKQQERLLREMEAVVARRESIITRSEAQARSDRKQPTHTDFQHTLQALRRAILQTHKHTEECDGVLAELKENQSSLTVSLKEKELVMRDLHNTISTLTSDLSNLQDTRERNLAQLLALQARAKQLQAVKEGRYITVATGQPALEVSMQRQQERLHAVSGVLERVRQDFPHHPTLRRITLLLSAHTPTHTGPKRA